MPATSLIGALGTHLAANVAGAPPVGGAVPTSPGDIPRITVSLSDIQPTNRGLGAVPSAPFEGALRVDTSLDLADPVLRAGGEDVALLSGDRRTLQLPHGAVVRASGDDVPPYTTADLLVRLGATTFTPVQQAPTPTQVQLDIPSGALTFANPLPATGTLQLGYFVGLWEVRVERFTAIAHLDVAAPNAAAVETLSAAVESALTPERGIQQAGFRRLEPRAVSTIAPIAGIGGAHRSRRLTYAAEFELIEPVIPSSGGPIRLVHVDVRLAPDPAVVESFEVP